MEKKFRGIPILFYFIFIIYIDFKKYEISKFYTDMLAAMHLDNAPWASTISGLLASDI